MAARKSLAPRPGRPKEYTAKTLTAAVSAYFAGIGRTVTVTEPVRTDRVDSFGHPIYEDKPIVNDGGVTIREWVFAAPPRVGELCRRLGVHPSTWSAWRGDEELGEVVEWADGVFEDYLRRELLVREGKNTRGVEFMLNVNYGVSEKKTVEISAPGLDMSQLSDEDLKKIIQQEEKTCTTTT